MNSLEFWLQAFIVISWPFAGALAFRFAKRFSFINKTGSVLFLSIFLGYFAFALFALIIVLAGCAVICETAWNVFKKVADYKESDTLKTEKDTAD